MKNKRIPTKSTKTPKRKHAAKLEHGNETPRRFLKLAVRDRERLMTEYGPRRAPLIEAAGNLIASTQFCQKDNWRKIPNPPTVDEIDFRSLDSNQLDFAVLWEYAREVRALYHEIEIHIPVEGANALPWLKLSNFFPIPITRLVSHNLLKIRVPDEDEGGVMPKHFGRPSPGFYELEPTLLMDLLKNLFREHKSPRGEAFVNRHKSSSELYRRKDEIVGIGPANFSNTLKLSSESPDAFRSFHAIGLDWSKGVSAIKTALNRWVDERLKEFTSTSPADVFKNSDRAISREVKLSKLALAQLAAWRAKRSGMNAEQYLEFRMKAFVPDFTVNSGRAVGGAERMKLKAKALSDKIGKPIYLRAEEFNAAAAKAESRLAEYASELARFDPSKVTVSIYEQKP